MSNFTDQNPQGLEISKGLVKPEAINPQFKKKGFHKPSPTYSTSQYIEGIQKGDRTILARAITLVESTKVEHRDQAREVLNGCMPSSNSSIRIGITGVPGAGKSTFIETFGTFLHQAKGRKIAVLAVDPSSDLSKGSLLGDKTRMTFLANLPHVFVRPSPSSGSLGGVAERTRESILLCEAAGFDTILIETVGVGQSEVVVHQMVDFFLLLMLAGAGDELQGMKRGIMERADAILITKSDGQNIIKANTAAAQYRNALHLFPPKENGWIPQVLLVSALENLGIPETWDCIEKFSQQVKSTGHFFQKRREQLKDWMHASIHQGLLDFFYQHSEISKDLKKVEEDVLSQKMSPFQASDELLRRLYLK